MKKANSDNALEKEVRRLEEGEAWEASDEPVHLEAKRPMDKVVPIRLTAEHWAELRKTAAQLGLGPTTLARVWILERLRLELAETGEDKGLLRLVREREAEYEKNGAKPWPQVEKELATSIPRRRPKRTGPR